MEPSLIQSERTLLRDLLRLSSERARAEAEVTKTFQTRKEAVEKEWQQARQRIVSGFEAEKNALEAQAQAARQASDSRFATEHAAVEKEYAETRQRLLSDHDSEREEGEKAHQEAAWSVTTVYEANKHRIDEQYHEMQKQAAEGTQRIQEIHKTAVALVEEWNQDTAYEKSKSDALSQVRGPEEIVRQLTDRIAAAEQLLTRLTGLRIPPYFKGERLLGYFLMFWVVAMAGLGAVLWLLVTFQRLPVYASGVPRGWYFWVVGTTAAVAVACTVFRIWLAGKAQEHVAAVYGPLRHALDDARVLCKRCQEDSAAAYPKFKAEIKQAQDKKLRQVDEKYYKKWEECKQRHDHALRQLDDKYGKLLAEIKQRHDQELRQAGELSRRLAEVKKRHESAAQQAQQNHQRQTAEYRTRYEHDWNTLATNWKEGLARAQALIAEINRASFRLFPDWLALTVDRTPPTTVPPGIRFGSFPVSMEQIPDGIPADARLRSAVLAPFTLPALLSFPERCSMLFKASDAGRTQAVQALQAVMLRLLTALPPGKVRFTIIDPVGLGENFASFMHLADFDEQLVTNRIWTEPQHIEQRLADITDHMENVIQKYLRNQFRSIEEYNVQAGEVAEPYRILVVANFPVNFSEAAARRLVSIANSGPGCGVYILLSVDAKQPLPPGFPLKELEQSSVNLVWKDQRFVWKDEDFGKYALRLDLPPESEQGTQVLQIVGEQAKQAGRVEVPFEFIAPAAAAWWTSDSRQGISVPLGRAGATKLQYLQLGQGTSQHVLIAGKTGSGKSTLLHALITNLALHYSPGEIQFYLIDFKKGVEFKTYASHGLPHARVVAIESEREFGLSVLQRLDAELRQRGELFRSLGVQDVNSYRQANGDSILPRILLIVDEFQEFFVEDDKLSQDVSLLLDRLVRQGRAFGIHVLLGSQTLGGAYSLARSTLGQMAVRIALQCSEADANLILSENNTAARLLSRPGEAIYNAANGLVEGNDFFQVVWLPDERREVYLRKLHDLARERSLLPTQPQIVFEGNAPAEVRKNHLLNDLLTSPSPLSLSLGEKGVGANPKAVQAWLGEALAIKDPTAAVFRPQSGSNLLLIGQQEESALAILATALVGLSAGAPGARILVIDSTPADDPLAGCLARVAGVLPPTVTLGTFRELPALVAEVAAEIERRQAAAATETPPLFLVLHGLQRFRDLRRGDDDFGFGGDAKPVSPAQQFAAITREGPAVGVHTLAWCDSLNNVQRALDRQGIREFEMRVLFQMSVADSSNLIDSPAASKLGVHRALFHTEERNQPEKFRPYGLPTDDWLEWVKERLGIRD